MFKNRASEAAIRVSISRTAPKVAFLRSLCADLRAIGLRPRLQVNPTRILLAVKDIGPIRSKANGSGNEPVDWQRDVARKRKLARALSEILPVPEELDPTRIKLDVRICRTRLDHGIYDYCRRLQSVHNGKRFGRQINALVYDIGQQKEFLVGAIGLASSLYSLRCRDFYLQWDGLDSDSVSLKNDGLRRTMDLAVCVAIAPYNGFLMGKLLAALATTEKFQHEHRRKYRTALRGIVTLSAAGVHCPIFNRIMLAPGGLYRRIGVTSGYTTTTFSRATLEYAKRIFERRFERPVLLTAASNTVRVLRYALRECGINPDLLLRLSPPKGVYIAFPRSSDCERLRGQHPEVTEDEECCVTETAAVDYWRKQLLPKRIGSWRPSGQDCFRRCALD